MRVFNFRYPVFNEYLEFRNIEQDELSDQKLKIKLYTIDVFKRKEILGQVDVLLSSLSFLGKENFDIFLFKQRSTVCYMLLLIDFFLRIENFD